MTKTRRFCTIVFMLGALSSFFWVTAEAGSADFPRRPELGTNGTNWTPEASKTAFGLTTTDLNAGLTPLDVANALVGGGVAISNVSYTGVSEALGTFSGGTGVIGFGYGIILSTGNIASVVGPNVQDGTSTDNGLPGDADLDSLIPGYTTYDATVFEFDFACTTSQTISFQFVFASEEYNEFVNSPYNDVFGFFVNGVNIALLPGSATPVSVENVNCGNPYSPPNGSNCAFYINNALPDGGGTINTEMDGLTVVLVATTTIHPGTNHIKLAIADAGDRVLDSDIFLKSESFVCGAPPDTLQGTIIGTVFNDANGNCIRNPGEAGLPGWTIVLNPGGRATMTDDGGNYVFALLWPGTYTVSEIPRPNWVQTCPGLPATHVVVVNSGQLVPGVDCGNAAIADIQDLTVTVAGGRARSGFPKSYGIMYSNKGTLPTVGMITLTLPSQVSHIESSPGGAYNPGTRTVTWDAGTIPPGFIGWLWTMVQIPLLPLTTVLTSTVSINPIAGDAFPADNIDMESQTVLGSYDPNEKLVTPTGSGSYGCISRQDTLRYQINFQNVGTDTAFNIIIRDELDPNLDISSLEVGASSHPYVLTIVGRELSWMFNDINLPDSIVNQQGSNGFVSFKVRPSATVPAGSDIVNFAAIYFDFNEPVATNVVSNRLECPPEGYTISGYVLTSGGAAIPGVVLGGLPGSPTTDGSGYYSDTVSAGWSGTVTPAYTSYTFSPPSRSYANVQSDRQDQNYTGTPRRFTISGNVRTISGTGVSGAVMSGLPAGPVTNASGFYSASVDSGWSGTVTPTHACYTFTPLSRSYSGVNAAQAAQDFTTPDRFFAISGRVRTASGAGIPAVVMNGLPGNPSTDTGGYYRDTVRCGWSGTVTANLGCYTFAPQSQAYSNVQADQTNKNHTGTLRTFSISGYARTSTGTGISGATMTGLPGNPVTDAGGFYSASVDCGWSGVVSPTHPSYGFNPSSRTYTNTQADQPNQNYAGAVKTFTISGFVRAQSGSGIAGVIMNGLPGNPLTDAGGYYSAAVSSGWSGAVTPTHACYVFVPLSRPYASVQSDQSSQDYAVASVRTRVISGLVRTPFGAGVSGVTMTGLPGNPVTDNAGFYSGTVECGWSGAVTPVHPCYDFSPASRSYADIQTDQLTQHYTGTIKSYTVSGYVRTSTGAGIGGVTLSGLPGNPVTASDGHYAGTADCGWSGTVTPSLTEYSFVPVNRFIPGVDRNVAGVDFVGNSPPACQLLPPISLNEDDAMIRVRDLWAFAADRETPDNALSFAIVDSTNGGCGARIDEGRHLSLQPSRDWFGTTRLTIRVTDPENAYCEMNLDVTVNAVNDPPTIWPVVPEATVKEDSSITLQLSSHEQDAWGEDVGAALVWSVRSSNGGLICSVHSQGTASDEITIVPCPDSCGSEDILLVLTDSQGASDSQVVQLAWKCINDPPVLHFLSPADSNYAANDSLVISWEDSDPDDNARITLYYGKHPDGRDSTSIVRDLLEDPDGSADSFVWHLSVVPEGVYFVSAEIRDDSTHAHDVSLGRVIVDRGPAAVTDLKPCEQEFVEGDYAVPTPVLCFQLDDAGAGVDLDKVEITISPGTSRGVLVIGSGYEGFHYDAASRRASLEIGDSLLPGTQTMSIVASDLLGKADTTEVHFRVSAGLELTDIVNSPNPFSGSTEFTFALTRAAEVRIDVYDLNGKRVKTVGPVTGAVGFNRIMWDGLSDAGRPLANGVYLYRITASNTSGSKTMVEKLAILR